MTASELLLEIGVDVSTKGGRTLVYCVTLDEMKDAMIKQSPLAGLSYAMAQGAKFPSFSSDAEE